ncbi:MAG: hypothetical protein RIR69_1038 [Actinomycetota bacterium]|jgi:SAM-dependent methyltransferase
MNDSGWNEHAQWWIDGFTNGADPEYEEQIIPMAVAELTGFTNIVDIGCGDGQISRALAQQGSSVLGIDPTELHIDIARERGGGPRYEIGSATQIPVADQSQDAAIACLVFEHIDEVDAAIAEVSRILKPGGRFSFFLNHPLLQTPGSGWVDDHIIDPPEQYWRIGPYLIESESIEEVERDVFIRFIHRPLSRYVNTLIENKLVINRMIEASPPEGFLERAPEYSLASTIPRLLYIRATKATAQ